MVLGQAQEHVWFYTDVDTGLLIDELPQDVPLSVLRHTVTLQYDKFFRRDVTVHSLLVRRGD